MKKLLAFLLVCSLVVVTTGCPSPTTKATTAAKDKDTTPTKDKADKEKEKEKDKADKEKEKDKKEDKQASLKVTADDVKAKAGTMAKTMVKVERKDFAADEEVKLTFEAPADSKIKVADATIAKDKKEAEVTVDVDKDTKVGDYTIKVNATSGKAKAAGEFKATVTDK